MYKTWQQRTYQRDQNVDKTITERTIRSNEHISIASANIPAIPIVSDNQPLIEKDNNELSNTEESPSETITDVKGVDIITRRHPERICKSPSYLKDY